MTNPKRGELPIVLGAKTYNGRVTIDSVLRIEQACGLSVLKIAQALSEGALTTTQIISILTPVIRGGGNDVNEKDIGNAIWDGGLAEAIKCVGEIVGVILSAGGDEGNDEGVTANP
jgi:hypothetical protein|tara:strand:- start:2638 stop:2985 length:348 start_codon:yes stop_codon:yes gene_type:complete